MSESKRRQLLDVDPMTVSIGLLVVGLVFAIATLIEIDRETRRRRRARRLSAGFNDLMHRGVVSALEYRRLVAEASLHDAEAELQAQIAHDVDPNGLWGWPPVPELGAEPCKDCPE